MVLDIKFFDSMEHLEPHCESCGTKVDYGTTTQFNEELDSHVCLKCGNALK
ncbi:hypothetical protein ACFLZ7_04005 [Nanoarchaeota archaeon]